MSMVLLKNGAAEPKASVVTTCLAIEDVIKSDSIAFFELVTLCRDPNHRLWGDALLTLRRLSLVEADGSVPPTVRNVVLSGAVGGELDLAWSNPLR